MGDDMEELDLDADLEETQARAPRRRGFRGYAATSLLLVRDAHRTLGAGPFLLAFGEWIAAPLYLVALQATLLSVVALVDGGTGPVTIGWGRVRPSLAFGEVAILILATGLLAASMSFMARSAADRFSVAYEAACNLRAVDFFSKELSGSAPSPPALREALLVARSDSRCCGVDLRIVLLTFPWLLAILLVFGLLLWLEPLWTLVLAAATGVAGVVLVRMNRRAVENARQMERMRESSSREHAELFRSVHKPETAPAGQGWGTSTRAFLDTYHRRLKVQARSQLVTNILMALTLAAIIPALWWSGPGDRATLIRLAFYVILLRIGFGYMRRVATAWTSFNHYFPGTQRYLATILPPPVRGRRVQTPATPESDERGTA